MALVEPRATVRVAGVPFVAVTFDEAVTHILTSATDKRSGLAVRLANAYCVTRANRYPPYKQLLQHGINYADGTPVALLVRRAARKSVEAQRVRGPALFRAVLEASVPLRTRHYLFGASDTTLQRLQATLERTLPGIAIVGALAPPVSDDPADLVRELPCDVDAERVDIVWVALGSPKQDFVADAIAAQRSVVCVGVGAAFDFVAGTTREAPPWMQRVGLEWLHRLTREPRRLWRRYIIGNAQFIYDVLRYGIQRVG